MLLFTGKTQFSCVFEMLEIKYWDRLGEKIPLRLFFSLWGGCYKSPWRLAMLACALQFLVRMKLSGFFLSRLSWNHKRSGASVIPVDIVSQGKGGFSRLSSKGSWVSPCLNISQRERAEGLVLWWWFQGFRVSEPLWICIIGRFQMSLLSITWAEVDSSVLTSVCKHPYPILILAILSLVQGDGCFSLVSFTLFLCYCLSSFPSSLEFIFSIESEILHQLLISIIVNVQNKACVHSCPEVHRGNC